MIQRTTSGTRGLVLALAVGLLGAGAGLAALLAGCEDEAVVCGAGETNCPGAGCVSLPNSSDHCGACGNACGDSERCVMGACTLQCASSTEQDCDRSPSVLDCRNLNTDRSNCGRCGEVCEPNEFCSQGDCEPCEPPREICVNACVDVMADNIQHCGECNHLCTGDTRYCECGTCVAELSGITCPGADGDADVDGDSDADVDDDVDDDSDAEVDVDPDVQADGDLETTDADG